MREHCVRCGRFVGEDALEIQDPRQATAHDPDGFTGTFLCAPDRGCNVIAESQNPLKFLDGPLAIC